MQYKVNGERLIVHSLKPDKMDSRVIRVQLPLKVTKRHLC